MFMLYKTHMSPPPIFKRSRPLSPTLINLSPTAGIITIVATNARIANPKDACNVPIESGTARGRNIRIPATGTRAKTGSDGTGRVCDVMTDVIGDENVFTSAFGFQRVFLFKMSTCTFVSRTESRSSHSFHIDYIRC